MYISIDGKRHAAEVAKIPAVLKANPAALLICDESEDENGRDWLQCRYDGGLFIWEEKSQARAADGGFCCGTATGRTWEEKEFKIWAD